MGRQVLGRYRIGEILGRGGAATVYRAFDGVTGDDVAVKEIPLDGEMARRAGAGVRAAGRLSHPAIVELLDFGEDDHACYLISELIEGSSLSVHRRAGTLSDAHYLSIVADVLDGLEHAHRAGVTHRDVKPANVLVDADGRGRLTDFGIARIAGEAGLTMTGGLIGTVSYMAPEQVRGGEAGPASDVYSACLVLYEGLTGHNPQAGDNPADSLRRVARGSVPPIASFRRDLPPELCDAIDAGLDPDPGRRPAARRLADVFRDQVHGAAPRAARPAPPPGRDDVIAPPRNPAAEFPSQPATPAPGWAARLVPAILVAVTTATAIDRWTDRPLTMAVTVAAGVGALFALAPWLTGLAVAAVACVALAREAPAFALLVTATLLVVIAPVRGRGRLLALPAVAPIIAGLGIAPIAAFAAGLVRGWAWRTWAAVSTFTGVVVWQLVAGADPAIDGGRVGGVWPDLVDVRSPFSVLTTLGTAVSDNPSVITTAAIMAGAVLLVPGLMRLRRGLPRTIGVILWLVVLVAGVRSTGGSVENAIGAFLPGGILVAVGAALPLERFRRGPDRRGTATLHANRGERQPAA